jgi:hypothetical protein
MAAIEMTANSTKNDLHVFNNLIISLFLFSQ